MNFSECIDSALNAFITTTLLLLVLKLISLKHKSIIDRFVLVSNSLLIVLSLTFILLFFKEFLWNEWPHRFPNYLISKFYFIAIIVLLSKGILPQILWFKKIRKNIWASIFLIPFLLIDFYISSIVNNITSLQVSWSPNISYNAICITTLLYLIILTFFS